MKISSKTPAEIIPVTFDFSNIVSAIDSIDNIVISTVDGVDASLLKEGIAIITGAKVVQLVRGGAIEVVYRLSCLVSVGAEKYSIDGEMKVREFHS